MVGLRSLVMASFIAVGSAHIAIATPPATADPEKETVGQAMIAPSTATQPCAAGSPTYIGDRTGNDERDTYGRNRVPCAV